MNTPTRNSNPELELLSCDIRDLNSAILRAETQAYIQQSFSDAYGAVISEFMPILLCLKDNASEIRAALGLRSAEHSDLFLENYLDRPVEQTMATAFEQPVNRNGIVEVGNLAVGTRGDARALIIAMTALLYSAQYEWVCFTIGPVLINSFTRLGLPLIDLGAASIDHLPSSERLAWGNYYDQKPRVMAGRLSDAYEFLACYSLQEKVFHSLWLEAQRIGRAAA